MPAGRPVNYDAKVNRLIAELRKALVAREAARIEGAVAAHIDGLVSSLQAGVHIGGARQTAMGAPVTSADAPRVAAAAKSRGRKRRSAASRQAQAARMKAYWKARKAAEAKEATGARKHGMAPGMKVK